MHAINSEIIMEIPKVAKVNDDELAALDRDIFKAKIIKQTVNSITFTWQLIEHAEVYEVEKYHRRRGWEVVAWCSRGIATIDQLDENFAYRFRINALKMSQNEKEYQAFSVSNDFVGNTLAALPSTLCLYRAIKKGQQFLVKRMLRRRPSLIEHPGPNGYLPLANAIVFGEHAIVDMLLTASASVHIGNPSNGHTPLHMAFYYGRLPVARILLNKRAQLEATDINRMTACHFAVDGNRLDILKFAIESGANIEARDTCGWTLLLRAVVMEADVGILKLLITNGASVEVKDNLGQNFMDLARLYKNEKALDFFKSIFSQKHE